MLEMAVAGRHRAVTAARGDGRRAAAGMRASWPEKRDLASSGTHNGGAQDRPLLVKAVPASCVPLDNVAGTSWRDAASSAEDAGRAFLECSGPACANDTSGIFGSRPRLRLSMMARGGSARE